MRSKASMLVTHTGSNVIINKTKSSFLNKWLHCNTNTPYTYKDFRWKMFINTKIYHLLYVKLKVYHSKLNMLFRVPPGKCCTLQHFKMKSVNYTIKASQSSQCVSLTHLGRLWHSCFPKQQASGGLDWSAPSGSTQHTKTHIDYTHKCTKCKPQ